MIAPDKGRVTAGIPGLTPQFRLAECSKEESIEYHRRLLLEALEKDESTVADDGDMPTTEVAARVGRPLNGAELQRRLRLLNPNFIFEVAKNNADLSGIYIADRDELGQPAKRFVCGMMTAFSPEFSVRHFREKQVPNVLNPGTLKTIKFFYRETRGWRTVLVRLLREGLVSPAAVDRVFQVTQGKASQNWQLFTGGTCNE